MSLSLFIVFLCLLINGYADWKKRQTYTIIYLATYLVLFILKPDLVYVGLGFLTLLFNRDNNLVGGGDIDSAFLIIYTLGFSMGLSCFFVACICSILYWIISKNKEIPFVTMLFLGYMFILLTTFLV
ncbi:hypothetical protein [Hungatella hathewayi]|uniref:hypothetical protein n=1 Tax=Hungatella hathewayi TaxID=154046 RepID=UPI00356A561E